jgi:hypothetical protein
VAALPYAQTPLPGPFSSPKFPLGGRF